MCKKEERNGMSILDFINQYYDVVYKSASISRNLSNVDEFLLIDNHASTGHTEINSAFINQFSDDKDFVLVEAIPSMKQIEQNDALQSIWLTTSSKILGWDTGTIQELVGSSTGQKISELEKKGQILIKQILSYEDSENQTQVAKLKLELIETVKELSILSLSFIVDSDKVLKSVEKSFPDRVKSMEASLVKAKDHSKYIFLIAGEYHLKQKAGNNDYLSLTSFYEFLETRIAIILSPKPQKVLISGSRKQKLLQEATIANMSFLFDSMRDNQEKSLSNRRYLP